jgi:hypothetical protein
VGKGKQILFKLPFAPMMVNQNYCRQVFFVKSSRCTFHETMVQASLLSKYCIYTKNLIRLMFILSTVQSET